MSTLRNSIVFIVLLVFMSINLLSLTFPVDGKSVSDITSSYGPRNLTDDNPPENYPDDGYDYDFHCALDIYGYEGTDVLSVADDGVVTDVNDNLKYIVIKYQTTDGDCWVKYMHIVRSVNKNDPVDAGDKIGETDYENHLDIRYYPWEAPRALDENAVYPGDIIDDLDNDNDPILLDTYESVIYDHTSLITSVDNGTAHANPSGKRYFEIGVRVKRIECDLDYVEISLSGTYNGNTVDEDDLLDCSSLQYPDWGKPGEVCYFPYVDGYDDDGDGETDDYVRLNCGDRSSDNDDVGHNSSSVGIYPRHLGSSDTYHTVYFRWYVDESIWSQTSDRVLKVTAVDMFENDVVCDNIELPTCINCNPPDDAPNAPTLTNVDYIQSSRSIKLEYEEYSTVRGHLKCATMGQLKVYHL